MKRFVLVGTTLALVAAFLSLSLPVGVKAAASTNWTKNGSAVLNNPAAAYPRVILDGSTYKMWMETGGAIKYSTSTDGITWSVLQATTIDAPVHEVSIIKDGVYKMWYNNLAAGVSYRTSVNGLNWSAATVVTFANAQIWDNDYICPTVIKDGGTYKMYYNANEGNGWYYVAYATSPDGTTWTEPQNLGKINSAAGNANNNLVLEQGLPADWDGYHGGESLYQTMVLKGSDGTYEMWYGGNKGGEAAGVDGFKIGYATSPDGITWTKSSANPVLSGTVGGADANGVYYPSVVQNGNTYQMWYWIYNGQWTGNVGYATAAATSTSSASTSTASTTTTSSLPETGANTSGLAHLLSDYLLSQK